MVRRAEKAKTPEPSQSKLFKAHRRAEESKGTDPGLALQFPSSKMSGGVVITGEDEGGGEEVGASSDQ